MKKTVITKGITYLEVPEENIRILCGCPENSIKFIMQIGLTQPVDINGFKLVSGPNAILLNDYSILNSHFLNFAEFPLLHHQYFQGASFNGTNEKFILIGNKNRVDDQYEYIRRGLHGLTSLEEILEAGVDVITAERILAIGDYHRGKNKEFNIINKVYLDKKTNIKGDLFVQRLAINKFKFTYNNEEEIIDINLNEFSKGVGLPYKIRNRHIKFDEFSVTTVGDGNGWNSDVPCMGAVINSKGKRFLVDSGPGSLDLIRHLGIMPSEVEGVFVTHSHDDHFAGLLSLLNSENKIKFFSTPLIISSVQKKFQALLNISRNELKRLIDFIELKENMWTNIGEMEVKPNYSFHTIETNIFYFRVKNSDGDWKSYGHITDIISRKDLNYMLEHDQSQKITKDWANLWFNHYLEECDLKRVDAGGGVVHGDSHDFSGDNSKKIILSHLNHDIDVSENVRFSHPTKFGHTEVLIRSEYNYLLEKSKNILKEISNLTKEVKLNISYKDILLIEPGEILHKKGDKLENVYLVLSGLFKDYDTTGYERKYVQGDFLYTFNNEKKSKTEFRAVSYSYILKIKNKNFRNCLSHIGLSQCFKSLRKNRYFTYGFSLVKLIQLSNIMTRKKIKKNQKINFGDNDYFFIEDGVVSINFKNKKDVLLDYSSLFVYDKTDVDIDINVKENGYILLFKDSDLKEFTSVLWSIFEEKSKIRTIVETDFI